MKGTEKERQKKADELGLTLKMKLFCEYYVSEEFFANGTQSYIAAYKPNKSKKNWYSVCKTAAGENLTKPHILEYINYILEIGGLNKEFADSQLLFLMTQNQDLSVKRAAIADFNKLEGRVRKKVDVLHEIKGMTELEKKKAIEDYEARKQKGSTEEE